MSEVRTARKRNEWLPNRMFDPASNPFAVQNLLDRTAPPFLEQRDEVPEAIFGVDPLAGGHVASGFERDRSLELPEDDFSVDETVADPFVAEDAAPESDFEADVAAEIYAAFNPDEDDANELQTDATLSSSETAMTAAPNTGDPAGEAVAEATAEAITDTAAEVIGDVAVNAELNEMATAPQAGEAASTNHSDGSSLVQSAVEGTDVVAEQHADTEPVTQTESETTADALLDNEAVMQKVEAARAEAYAQGMEAGRNQGRDAERPIAHQQGYDEGLAAGLEQGRAETQTDEQKRQQAAHQAKLDQLQSVIDQLQELAYNPDALFEPMKKLAVHLAEQLVRGELTQSPQAISRLVDNALRELNSSGDKPVVIHLHADDLEAYRPTVEKYADSLILRPDNSLERGSVRVSLDGSVVEDLMQRRVEGVKKSIAQAPAPSWRTGGNRLSDRLQTGQPVDDVTVVDKAEQASEKMLETAAPSDDHA